MGTLFVVATPIGNLEDMTPRALRTLREVRVIAAEDTRHSGRLLRHFGIETPLLSYHQHNQRERRGRLLTALDQGDVALITDAGTPAVSDRWPVSQRGVPAEANGRAQTTPRQDRGCPVPHNPV